MDPNNGADPTGVTAQPGVLVPPPVAPAEPAPPQVGAPNVNRIEMTVQVPNLRNGDVATITQAAPRASIPVRYKWVHIGGMTHDHMVANVDAIIRATYAQLLAGAGAQVSEAQRDSVRKEAIVLGATRAGAASAWQLTPPDMNSQEIVGSGSTYVPVAGSTVGRVAVGNGTAGGNYTVAVGMAPINEVEVAAINVIAYLGMCVPILQGISLVLTGHHYLPNTANHFNGMKKQALQIGGEAVKSWIDAMGTTFDDLAFHKACHPISPPQKRRWAKDPEVAMRLVASGHTAAAIRVPALPSDAQGAKAAVAVFTKAAPVVKGMGHTISWEGGLEIIRAVEQANEGRQELDAVDAAKSWVVGHAASIGFCTGIVRFLSEAEGAGQETTLRAFSMRKIMSDQSAEVNRGATYARAYMHRIREAANEGRFEDPNIIA